jgi:hypothetical protein
MGQKFCTSCGAALSENLKFCGSCGSPVLAEVMAPGVPVVMPEGQATGAPPLPLPPPGGRKGTAVTILAAMIVILFVAAVVFQVILPNLPATGSSPAAPKGPVTTAETPATVMTGSPALPESTAPAPAQKPDPFPEALRLKDRLPFGSGSIASEATVYRYWINDTYEWHNDNDNRYYVEKPRAGNKFLFVFVHLQNNGDYRVWFPPAANIVVSYNGATYTEDKSHYKPDKASDEEATPIEVREVMYFQKLNGDEYAEDFGFSHGTELAYLYPGTSNAVDGYIVYQVPRSLTPEETYVRISFNAQDHGVWKLG